MKRILALGLGVLALGASISDASAQSWRRDRGRTVVIERPAAVGLGAGISSAALLAIILAQQAQQRETEQTTVIQRNDRIVPLK